VNNISEKAIDDANRLARNFSVAQSRNIIKGAFLGWVRQSATDSSLAQILPTFESEWNERLIALRDSLLSDAVSRYSTLSADATPTEIENIIESILENVAQLNKNEALDFFAQLSVEWARRTSIEGLDPIAMGYKIPASTDINTWATSFWIWTLTQEFDSLNL
jgi:hypothetical protein